MNILWLTLDSPLPLDSGGRIGVYKRIKKVSEKHIVTLMYFYADEMDEENCKILKQCCKRVCGYPKEKNVIKKLVHYIFYPYTVSTRMNKKFIEDVDEFIIKDNIDLIIVDFPQTGYSLMKCKKTGKIPIVMSQYNVEWKRYEEIAKSSVVPLFRKIIARTEAFKLKKFEEKLYRRINMSAFIFVTLEDRDYFGGWIKDINAVLEVIPTDFDIMEGESPYLNDNGKNIIFVGDMSNELNPEGALWFTHSVFPKIREKVPEALFYIVGRNPINKLLHINDPGVIVTGSVENVKKYYDIADVVVIPVLHGGGIKSKLLEAVGCGKLVITTASGAKGTEFINGTHILVTDDAEEFARYCIDALTDREKYRSMRNNAVELFASLYAAERVGTQFCGFLEKILMDTRTRNCENENKAEQKLDI